MKLEVTEFLTLDKESEIIFSTETLGVLKVDLFSINKMYEKGRF